MQMVKSPTKRKIAYMLLFYVIAYIAIYWMIAETNAWLKESEESRYSVVVSSFEIKGKAFFSKETREDLLTAELLSASTPTADLMNIELYDDTKDNYIGYLRFGVLYEGISPMVIRVRVLEEWIDRTTEEIRPAPYTAYVTSTPSAVKPGWIDNRKLDFCYYYSSIVPSEMSITGSGISAVDGVLGPSAVRQEAMMLITDFKDTVNSNRELKIFFEVEAVQPNRYRELWFRGRDDMLHPDLEYWREYGLWPTATAGAITP